MIEELLVLHLCGMDGGGTKRFKQKLFPQRMTRLEKLKREIFVFFSVVVVVVFTGRG